EDSYTEEEINRAIEISGLSKVIKNLPNGINTYIEEGGKNFSGGEKQKITWARALLSGKSIFLLDERFSALDKQMCVEVEIISLRYNNNLYMYDNIIVLKDGEIVENESYDELLKQDTYFYDLIQSNKGGENKEEKKQCSSEIAFS